jgi:hypothetical protein
MGSLIMKIVKPVKIGLAILGLLALFAAGLLIRRTVLQAQYVGYGRILPFNLESALEFRYVRMLFLGQALPEIDRQIQVPAGVNVRQTYTIGAEYVYAWAAHLWPADALLSERVRWVAAAWFCLGIPLLSLWLWWWLRSAWAAGIGGAYYAVALAGVIRSTGQELSHENFALPILIGALAAGAFARTRRSLGAFLGAAALAAVLFAWSLACWDLIQFVVGVWALLHYFRLAGRRYFAEARARLQWGLTLAALLFVGLVNPYLRAHAFLASPAMLLAYGTAVGVGLQWAAPDWKGWPRWVLLVLLAVAPLGLGALFAGTYAGAYGHFGELLQAKLLFFNRKPADPALLTFAQRILWVPALNSANFKLTINLFPATLPLLLLTLIIVCSRARWRSDPEIIHLLLFCGLAFPAFILFVRFHVFLIIGICALLGWAAAWASAPAAETAAAAGGEPGRSGWGALLARGLVLFLLLGGVGAEAANVLVDPWRWGSAQTYLDQKQDLLQWLKDNSVREPVLADFGISAFLLTYADCPIVLHPKFESPEIRRRVQAYGETLFKADESRLRDWAGQYGAVWYVYSRGQFADRQPEQQLRYFVDALRPPPGAAARLFEQAPDRARYFQWLWGDTKYRVFRIIRRADELQAARIVAEAEVDLAHGNLAEAEAKATLALLHDPHHAGAQRLLLDVAAAREQAVNEKAPAPRRREP